MKRPDDLATIAPGVSAVECVAETFQAGPFSSQLHLFVDDGGTREVVFTLNGTAVKSPTGR